MKLNRLFTILVSASLVFSLTSCNDDKGKGHQTEVSWDQPGEDYVPDTATANAARDEAKTYLEICDFKTASEKLETAYNANKIDADIAFRRSVLGLINLVHHSEIQSLLKSLGFTGSPVDMSPLWQSDGIFKQMVSHHPDWDRVYDKLPHPAINGDENAIRTISKSLTIGSFIDALDDMDNDLISLAVSFETAANGLEGDQLITIDDAGCSLNELKFGSADLYFMAALLHIAMAWVDWASAYDFNIGIREIDDYLNSIEDYDEYTSAKEVERECDKFKSSAEFISKRLFKVNASGAGKEGRRHIAAAAANIKAAADAAPNMKEGAFFGWSELSAGMLTDIKSIAQKVIDSDNGTKPIIIPQISPVLSIDLTKLFDKAIQTSRTIEPFCDISAWCSKYGNSGCTHYVYEAEKYYYNEGLIKAFLGEDILNTITGKTIYTYQADDECVSYYQEKFDTSKDFSKEVCSYGRFNYEYSHSFSSAWEHIDLKGLFNPHGYFDD